MPEKNETNELAIIPSGVRYEDALWAKIFDIWLFLADRNCARTHRMLLTEFRETPNFDESKFPTVRQIQNKAKREDWDLQGNQKIRELAPTIDDSQISRLLVMADKALDFADRLLSGEYDHHSKTGNLAVRWDAAKEMLKFRGLGTAGAVGNIPTLKIEVEAAKDDPMALLSNEEKLEALRVAVLEKKQLKKLTGHKQP